MIQGIGDIMILGVFFLINGVMLLYLGSFVYAFFKFEKVRNKVVESIENGDNTAHTQDAYKAVTLAFAIVFGWSLLDMIFIWAYTGRELVAVVASLTIIFGGLIGVSFKS